MPLCFPRTMLLALLALPLATTACKKKPTELAPVQAGDTFEFRVHTAAGTYDDKYPVIFTLKAAGSDSLILEANPPGDAEPVEVDRALDPGKRIRAHYLGQLWLPPAQRVVGAKSLAGRVAKQMTWYSHQVWEVEEFAGGKGGRWFFDVNHGFLIGSIQSVGSATQTTYLVSSSVAGVR